MWNDLLVALFIGAQNPSNTPLTIVVSNLVSFGGGWQYLAAAAFVTMAGRWPCSCCSSATSCAVSSAGLSRGATKREINVR